MGKKRKGNLLLTAERPTIRLTLTWGKLWLIRIFQVAIFDLSNRNSHSSLLHQFWWGYFPTDSLSRRNTGLTLCNNIKMLFAPQPRFSGHGLPDQVYRLRSYKIRRGKGMTPHLEINCINGNPKSQKWRGWGAAVAEHGTSVSERASTHAFAQCLING